MKPCIDRKAAWALATVALAWTLTLGSGITHAGEDGKLDPAHKAVVEKELQKMDLPWVGGCQALTAGVPRKNFLLTCILYLGMEDPGRSEKLLDEFMAQLESLNEEERYLYAPVLSHLANQRMDETEWAIPLWRRALRLMDKAELPADCPDSLLQDWKRTLRKEGVIILTMGGLRGEAAKRAARLQEAAELAESLGMPLVAPLDEDPPADHLPAIDFWAKPDYPKEARKAGLEGQVHVQILVSEYGEVVDAQLLVGVHPLLDEAALAAARLARFAPGRRGGVPVKAYMDLPYNFRLH